MQFLWTSLMAITVLKNMCCRLHSPRRSRCRCRHRSRRSRWRPGSHGRSVGASWARRRRRRRWIWSKRWWRAIWWSHSTRLLLPSLPSPSLRYPYLPLRLAAKLSLGREGVFIGGGAYWVGTRGSADSCRLSDAHPVSELTERGVSDGAKQVFA